MVSLKKPTSFIVNFWQSDSLAVMIAITIICFNYASYAKFVFFFKLFSLVLQLLMFKIVGRNLIILHFFVCVDCFTILQCMKVSG